MVVVDWESQLIELGQAHILSELRKNGVGKERVFADLDRVEESYPGGVKGYVTKARQLLKESAERVNPFEGYTPEIPEIVKLDPEFDAEEVIRLEDIGTAALGRLAFCLVAGGLGERLGYNGIKLSMPTEVITGTTYLEYYISTIIEIQKKAVEESGIEVQIPLAIMCSRETIEPTRTLLEENNNYQLKNIVLMLQEEVPVLRDPEARFVTDENGVATKPHGHGDIHQLLMTSGLTKKWEAEGRTHMVFFQDTNALALRAIPAFLGISISRGFVMNSLAISRVPGEAVGSICKLRKNVTDGSPKVADRSSMTINVEYNVLEPLLHAAGMGGDVPGLDGMSPYPGNTNCLMFNLKSYNEVLEITAGVIPEFVNPKYQDESRTKFKSAARLECMMQEFPRLMVAGQTAGCFQAPRWFSFSTCKNKNSDAAAKVASGGVPESAFSAEADLYASNVKLVKSAMETLRKKFVLEPARAETWDGVTYPLGCRLVLKPAFAWSFKGVRERLKDCDSIVMMSDDCIVLDRPNGVKSIGDGEVVWVDDVVTSYKQRHTFKAVDVDAKEEHKIRGYI